MRTVAIASLIALSSTLCAGGPSADQIAGLVKAASAIADGTTITTKFGGATVAVTRKNGVATCTVDGKPYAVRVPGTAPAVAGMTTVTNTAVQQIVGVSASRTQPSQVIQMFISGFVDSSQNAVQAGVQYFGTFVYGGLAFTGLAFNLNTNGNFFANNIAESIKIGPYSTSN